MNWRDQIRSIHIWNYFLNRRPKLYVSTRSSSWSKTLKSASFPTANTAVQFGVSRMTLRQAIQTLVEEGILERHIGSGTYIARKKVQEKMSGVTSLTELTESLIRSYGKVATSKQIGTSSAYLIRSIRKTFWPGFNFKCSLSLSEGAVTKLAELKRSLKLFVVPNHLRVGPTC